MGLALDRAAIAAAFVLRRPAVLEAGSLPAESALALPAWRRHHGSHHGSTMG